MNGPMIRALLLDALYQVFDNKIFRLLMLVVIGLVAPTFLIGFRDNDVQILWGWQELTYETISDWFNMPRSSGLDQQGVAIQFYQRLVVDGLCGNLGMVFCVAATAFFVPRMLEKGSADVLMSKPLSRTTLLLARYVSGILFVAILAFVLVIGMYLGFLIASGYSDTGFLWGGFTLVYLYAIVHAISTLAGVLTRSTVAATLIALVCFMGTGCVHQIWRLRTYIDESSKTEKQRAAMETDREAEAALPAVPEEERGALTKFALLTLDTFHYTLPKTSDADIITSKLRRAIERTDVGIEDETARLTIPGPPEGFELIDDGLPEASKGRILVDLEKKPVAWRIAGSGSEETARIEISRRSRLVERPNAESGGRQRSRKLSATAAAAEWIDRAKTAGVLDSEPTERTFAVDGVPTAVVGWFEKTAGGRRAREVAVLSAGDWLVEISETADPGWSTPSERSAHLDRFLHGSSSDGDGFQIARKVEFENPDDWYARRFAADAPLPFNLWFSIGSSIAFSVVMLVIASWKLSRIDF